jgi:pimeloyl-ACP methyl ester carboxylesterase
VDVRADAAQLSLPTLLIYGELDEETPVWYGRQFHELMTDSVLEVLPGAGHFVHIDRADDVEKTIKDFLQ